MNNSQLSYIKVGSITNALRGRDYLRSNGIKAYIDRTPKYLDRVGCGYSIFVSGDSDKAANLLKSIGIAVKGIEVR